MFARRNTLPRHKMDLFSSSDDLVAAEATAVDSPQASSSEHTSPIATRHQRSFTLGSKFKAFVHNEKEYLPAPTSSPTVPSKNTTRIHRRPSNHQLQQKSVDKRIRNGHELYVWESGEEYDGHWKDNKKHGYGIMIWSNGDEYEGFWDNNKRDDMNGKYSYSHGAKYVGGFVQDRRHGYGTLTWPDGDKFVGSWHMGGRVGKGVLITSTGVEVVQEWNEPQTINYSESIPLKYPPGTRA